MENNVGNFGVEPGDTCDELHFSVGFNGDSVILRFCQPVSWITMLPENALAIGKALTESANCALSLQRAANGVIH